LKQLNNFKIYKNVEIGKNVLIEDYCIIGKPALGKNDGEHKTIIGDNSIIRSHTIIYSGNEIGENFQTGHHVVIRENNSIGRNVSIGTLSCIEHHIKIEDNVRIHSQVFVPEFSTLKTNCWLGPNVVLTNAKYPKSKNVKNNLAGPTIEESVKIGANSTILPNVKIGKNSLVGAGSVVTKNIPKNKIVFGNPAEVHKSIDEIEEYKI
jgi:acetyltransferase-like isoleucine patch superfamily enzyme